jgi:hypothetical protein
MTFSSENHKLASDITKAVFEKLGMQQYWFTRCRIISIICLTNALF